MSQNLDPSRSTAGAPGPSRRDGEVVPKKSPWSAEMGGMNVRFEPHSGEGFNPEAFFVAPPAPLVPLPVPLALKLPSPPSPIAPASPSGAVPPCAAPSAPIQAPSAPRHRLQRSAGSLALASRSSVAVGDSGDQDCMVIESSYRPAVIDEYVGNLVDIRRPVGWVLPDKEVTRDLLGEKESEGNGEDSEARRSASGFTASGQDGGGRDGGGGEPVTVTRDVEAGSRFLSPELFGDEEMALGEMLGLDEQPESEDEGAYEYMPGLSEGESEEGSRPTLDELVTTAFDSLADNAVAEAELARRGRVDAQAQEILARVARLKNARAYAVEVRQTAAQASSARRLFQRSTMAQLPANRRAATPNYSEDERRMRAEEAERLSRERRETAVDNIERLFARWRLAATVGDYAVFTRKGRRIVERTQDLVGGSEAS